MKILHVIPTINPDWGGPIQAVLNYNDYFLAYGHSAEVVCLDKPKSNFISSYEFPVHALGHAYLGYGINFKLVDWLKSNSNQYDCVIVHGLWQFTGYASWLALAKSKTPYFVFAHGMLDPWFKRQYPLKHLKKWFYWPWGQFPVLRDAKAVLFTAEQERILARQSFWLYSCNEVVLSSGYGTATPPGDAQKQKQQFLTTFPQLNGKRICLFLSRIHPKKGLDLLIDAFAAVCKQDPQLHLVIAGPDQIGWQKHLEQQAASLDVTSRMTWAGMLKDDLKWGAFYCAELFCLPSHQENFGIAVAEALSCGLPVLIGEPVNISEEIRNARAGLVVQDTPAGTCNGLKQWLSMTREEQLLMGKEAQQLFDDKFTIDRAAESLLTTINNLIK